VSPESRRQSPNFEMGIPRESGGPPSMLLGVTASPLGVFKGLAAAELWQVSTGEACCALAAAPSSKRLEYKVRRTLHYAHLCIC